MNTHVKEIVTIALSVALISVCATITLPFGPVPFTLQTYAITLIMFSLKPKTALVSILIYVLIGTLGAPVFSSMRGGIGVILGPTGGFLIGYTAFIYFGSCFIQKIKKIILKRKMLTIASISIGILMTFFAYVLGCAQYMLICGVNLQVALFTTILPFIIPDTIKIFLAYETYLKIKGMLET